MPFLASVFEIVRVRAEKKGLAMVGDFDARSLPKAVSIDGSRLRQVLLNLLDNAVKFTDSGEVRFRVEMFDGRVRFTVEDQGVGMASEEIERIFEPFEQAGESGRKAAGAGLGLSISRSLVRLMGGAISVVSEPGSGSVFSFDLDLQEVPSDVVAPEEDRRTLGVKNASPKLLIVDDNPQNLSVLEDLLVPLGFVVRDAADAPTALTIAEQFRPDLMITDLIMPEIDGFQLIRQVRRSETLKNMKIVAASADVEKENRTASLEAGADLFLPKPMQADRLFDSLQRLLALQWRYEANGESAICPEDIAVPPKSEMERLADLAEMGDIEALERALTDLKRSGDAFGPFADLFLELTAQFKIGAIKQKLGLLLEKDKTEKDMR